MSPKDIRVLLVDDEEELIEYISKRLLRSGFAVRVTNSGQAAVDLADYEEFDVAVVDLKMPGMDGVETQKKLKEIRPFMQTVVLTGHGSLDSALQSGRQDAYCYLEKPADHDELIQAIVDGAQRKTELEKEQFNRELTELTESGARPREIIRAVDRLRTKYKID